MADVGIKELLEAGVHFGHQTRRWNPAMRRYIHGERDGIHVIDLLQTEKLLAEAIEFCSETAGRGGKILFVGTKKQASEAIEQWAERSGMPYVSRRWLGGLLTNYHTISKRIKRLHELTELQDDEQLDLLPTKERMTMEAELAKLEYNLGGVRDMERVPDAIIIVDLISEEIALAEATRLGIPVIGLVDTNCDPRGVDFVIPGNDDAIRSCELIVRSLGEAILTSASAWEKAEEARRAREAEEKRKREEAERERREAEAKAKAEAEAAAKAKAQAEAEAAAKAGKQPKAPAAGKGKGGGKPAPKPAAGQRAKPVPVSQQTKSQSKEPEAAAGADQTPKADEGAAEAAAPAGGNESEGEGK